jgi:hypothetical protein
MHFSRELRAKLDRSAADIHTPADDYVQQLVEHHVDYDLWFRQKVADGLDQLRRGTALLDVASLDIIAQA